ncbi:MAG TPA: class I SAM-dependent methyltransferase [Thermoanaerobaculia bacterium]|nr:class I SAM-dependent methyltransferase [Thermoanaerobaculia bacterium]
MSDERTVDTPPAGLDDWRAVWAEDRRYRASASGLRGFFRRFVRGLLAPDLDRQKDFNLALLDVLADLRREIEAARRDFRADVDAVQRDVRAADDALATDIASARALVPVAAKRNDALIAALDQKIETLAVRVRDAINPVVAPLAPDVLYRRLEDSLRGSEAEVRSSVEPYVRIAQAPVIDVGCGRGELLHACREAGIEACGFDTNERSVADLRARGFDVALAGVPECFASYADGSVGTVVAMHVVEHLPVEILFALFRESARVLRAGGLLIIETPNAESLLIAATDFWRDPTHLAPRHPAALTVLAREHGFAIDEVRAVHELPEGTRIAIQPDDPLSLQRVIHAINDRLFAPQDLRLIARKTS